MHARAGALPSLPYDSSPRAGDGAILCFVLRIGATGVRGRCARASTQYVVLAKRCLRWSRRLRASARIAHARSACDFSLRRWHTSNIQTLATRRKLCTNLALLSATLLQSYCLVAWPYDRTRCSAHACFGCARGRLRARAVSRYRRSGRITPHMKMRRCWCNGVCMWCFA